MTGGLDEVAEWEVARQRVEDLVAAAPAEATERRVPACPGWTVRELLSHVVGLGADVVAGDEPEDHHPAWTQAHIDLRADRSVSALLEEWRGVAGPLTAWMRTHTTRPLNDLLIHEQDLRGALGVPGARDTDGPRLVRDRMLARFAPKVEGLPPLALESPDGWSWCSAGDPAEAAVLLRADGFDLARALMSRRSAAQLRSWVVRGDVAPYLGCFEVLGPLPVPDLTDGADGVDPLA